MKIKKEIIIKFKKIKKNLSERYGLSIKPNKKYSFRVYFKNCTPKVPYYIKYSQREFWLGEVRISKNKLNIGFNKKVDRKGDEYKGFKFKEIKTNYKYSTSYKINTLKECIFGFKIIETRLIKKYHSQYLNQNGDN